MSHIYSTICSSFWSTQEVFYFSVVRLKQLLCDFYFSFRYILFFSGLSLSFFILSFISIFLDSTNSNTSIRPILCIVLRWVVDACPFLHIGLQTVQACLQIEIFHQQLWLILAQINLFAFLLFSYSSLWSILARFFYSLLIDICSLLSARS